LLALGVSSQTDEAFAFPPHGFTAAAQTPPPTPKPTPAEDTTRYVMWMEKQLKPIADKPHEDLSLRIGDWGFFYHGERPVGSWTLAVQIHARQATFSITYSSTITLYLLEHAPF
jgi:hypothetical protein